MAMTYCICKKCGKDILLDNWKVELRGGYLCDECYEALNSQKSAKKNEVSGAGQEYRRIRVTRTRCGYAVVPANTDEEALEVAKKLKEEDLDWASFDWDSTEKDFLETVEVVETCGPHGEVV